MKNICALLVAVCQLYFGYRYVRKIRSKKASPTISTWIMFLAGAGPSFVTSGVKNHWDLISGVLNGTDLIYITMILIAICVWGGHNTADQAGHGEKPKLFDSFERWYLVTAGAVILYGVVSGDMRGSNWCTQIMMSIAYLPMWQKFYLAGKNIESFFGWMPNMFVSTVALVPAFYEGNEQSAVYACRSLLFSLLTVGIMTYYELKSRRSMPLRR